MQAQRPPRLPRLTHHADGLQAAAAAVGAQQVGDDAVGPLLGVLLGGILDLVLDAVMQLRQCLGHCRGHGGCLVMTEAHPCHYPASPRAGLQAPRGNCTNEVRPRKLQCTAPRAPGRRGGAHHLAL